MNKVRLLSVVFIMLCLHALPSLGVVLDVRSGILHGATGITVGSDVYDISFQEGTCIGLFDNCDEVSDFFFSDLTSAATANLALLDQVFLDGTQGMFDSIPSLTFGCERAGNQCVVQSPIGSQAPSLPLGADAPNGTYAASTLFNHKTESRDTHTGFGQAVRGATTVSPFDRLVITDGVFVIWSLSNSDGGDGTNPVPIPATLYLLLIGLAIMAYKYRPAIPKMGYIK